MNSNNKIYCALKQPFINRKENLGDKISNDVRIIVQELKNQDMNKDELIALKSCYETSYQDSMGSFQIIVTLLAFFAGIDIFSDLPFCSEICFIMKLILFLFWLLYSYCKIKKLNKDNATLRNHIMAVSILLAKNEQ